MDDGSLILREQCQTLEQCRDLFVILGFGLKASQWFPGERIQRALPRGLAPDEIDIRTVGTPKQVRAGIEDGKARTSDKAGKDILQEILRHLCVTAQLERKGMDSRSKFVVERFQLLRVHAGLIMNQTEAKRNLSSD